MLEHADSCELVSASRCYITFHVHINPFIHSYINKHIDTQTENNTEPQRCIHWQKERKIETKAHFQYNTVQSNPIQYNTVQYSTIQHKTRQYPTPHYSTMQHIRTNTQYIMFLFPYLTLSYLRLPALHSITFHYVALRYISRHHNPLRYIKLHCNDAIPRVQT